MRPAYVAARTSAAATSTAQASSARPVCWRTGTRAGPVAPPRTVRTAGRGQHQEAQADQQRPPGGRHRDGDDRRRGGERPAARRARGSGRSPSSHREGALAGHRVGRDVAQVVGDQDRAGQRADADRGVQRRPLPGLGLDVRRADDRDQPEEHEHHHLAEAEVAVGLRAAGVEPGRQHADRADRDQPPGGRRREHQPGDRRDAEGEERRPLHRAGRGRARPDQPHRADPVGVGAADAVGVVVGVVDRRPGAPGSTTSASSAFHQHGLVDVRRDAGAGEHRATRRGEGARARACEPLRGGRHEPQIQARPAGYVSARESRAGTTREVVGVARSAGWPPTTPSRWSSRPPARPARPSGWCCPARRCWPRSRPPSAGSAAPGRWLLALPASYVAGLQVVVPVAGRRARAGPARRARLGRGGDGDRRPRLRLAGADPAAPAARRRRRDGRAADVPHRPARRRPDRRRRCASARPRTRGARRGDVRLGGDRRRLRLRRRTRWTASALAVDADGRIRIAGPDALRRVRRRPGADRRGAGRRLVPDLRRRPARRGRPAPGARPARRHGRHRRGQRARRRRWPRRLREHPAVAAAEVLGVPDAEWGNRVVAFVVRRRRSTSTRRGTGSPRRTRAPGRRASWCVARRDPAARQRQARPASRCGSCA